MRCRMRCGDIWRCGGPIKKYVPVESIGIEGRTQEMTFDSQVPPYSVTYSISISPSDATKKDVRIESNNPSIISVDSVESDQVTFTIHNEGDARVRITSLADADISDEYSVSVVTPSEGFAPNNGIFVDVDTEGTATGRKRETRATAMGDRFTARVFMLNEDNPNYVLLEWIHGGDVSKTYVGAANGAHTRAMFTEETTEKLAREIETLWDDGQIANGFVKFTDDDWIEIQEYYATDLTPESVAALQAELMDNAIVREPEQNCFTSMFFGYSITPVSEVNVGKNGTYVASWRGLPDDQHIVDPVVYEIGDENIATITNYTVYPADEQWSEAYSCEILGVDTGQTTITFYSVNNPRGTKTVISVTVIPPDSYYYINLHEAGEIDVEEGNTYTCYAEVENHTVDDMLAASGYDDSIISVSFQKRNKNHGGWWSDWNINITGLQAGETTVRIHSVNNPEVYEDLLITVSEPIPSCPASIQYVWGNDATIEVGQTAAVITNFTTTAECENVDYSNIVAYVRASYNVPSDVATASIDFNENKVYVTGVKAGECTVMFTDGDRSWSNNVTVTEPQPTQTHITSVSPNSITVNEGDMVDGSISYEPYDGDTTNFSAQSENTSIATVDFMGASGGSGAFQVWGVSAGSTNVVINDGFNSWTIPVTVVGAEPEQGQLMFICNSREFGSLIGPNGETWDWDTPYTFELGTQVTYNGETLTIGEDVFSFNPVFTAPPQFIDVDGNTMEIDVPYELSDTEGSIYIEFYYEPISGNDFEFVDDGEGYYVGNSEFNFNGPSHFVEEGYVVENSDSGAEIENAIVTITGDGSPCYVEVKVPTGDVNPGDRVRVVRRTEEEGYDLGEIAGDIPSTQSYTMTINVENLPEGADINGGITDSQSGETLEEISVSSFPMTIELIGRLGLNCESHEGDGAITIVSLNEDLDEIKEYGIDISCEGYKPLFEPVGFDLEDGGEGNYYCEIGKDSNVSMTIGFTPVE